MISDTYNGIGPNATALTSVGITSSTDATPIVVTSSGAHGLSDGDEVEITGHATNVAANGIWKIGYLSSSTFSLLTSVGSGGGAGAGGSIIHQGLLSTVTIPDDGDAAAAASWNVAYETVADRTAYLAKRVGAYRIHKKIEKVLIDRAFGSAMSSWSAASVANGAYARIAGATSGIAADAYSSGYEFIQPGDVIDASFSTSITNKDVVDPHSFAVKLAYSTWNQGGSDPLAGTLIAGTNQVVGPLDSDHVVPIHLHGRIAPSIPNGRYFNLYAYIISENAVAKAYALIGDAVWNILILRPR